MRWWLIELLNGPQMRTGQSRTYLELSNSPDDILQQAFEEHWETPIQDN